MNNIESAIPKIYGKKLRERRKELKISQGELAESSGLHITYISSVERGHRNISLVNIYKISKALNSHIKEFFPEGSELETLKKLR